MRLARKSPFLELAFNLKTGVVVTVVRLTGTWPAGYLYRTMRMRRLSTCMEF